MATLPTIVPATPLDASDDTRHVFNTDTTETASYALGDTPADFSSMDTLSWTIEYLQSGRSATNSDTYGLSLRVVNGATILAAADSGGTFVSVNADVTNTSDQTTGPTAFAYINTGASKATWDGASIEIRQSHTQLKSADGGHIEVDYAALVNGTYTAASGGQTIAVGQIIETDTSQAIAGNLNAAVGQITETNLSQAISAVLGNVNISVGQITETDISQAITNLAGQIISVGQITETDIAQPITVLSGNINVAIGQAAETDIAQAVSVSIGNIIAVTQAAETDLAQSITTLMSQIVSVGQVIETDVANSFLAGIGQTIGISQVTETDTAQIVSVVMGVPTSVGQAIETDTAFSFTLFISVGQVFETDIAQAISVQQTAPLPDFDVIPATLNESYNIQLNNHPIIDDMQVYEATDQVHTAIHKIVSILGGVDAIVQTFGSIRTITFDDWIEPTDNTVLLDGSSQVVTAFLWPASLVEGKEFVVKAIDTSNPVYLSPASGDTIDNSTSPISIALNAVIRVKSDGTNWWRI